MLLIHVAHLHFIIMQQTNNYNFPPVDSTEQPRTERELSPTPKKLPTKDVNWDL